MMRVLDKPLTVQPYKADNDEANEHDPQVGKCYRQCPDDHESKRKQQRGNRLAEHVARNLCVVIVDALYEARRFKQMYAQSAAFELKTLYFAIHAHECNVSGKLCRA